MPKKSPILDETRIPKGIYCYDEKGLCPYWNIKKDLPEQYNGYCAYLGKSDLDLSEVKILVDVAPNSKTKGKKIKGSDLPFPTSLLWDQCKECGVNMDDEFDIE